MSNVIIDFEENLILKSTRPTCKSIILNQTSDCSDKTNNQVMFSFAPSCLQKADETDRNSPIYKDGASTDEDETNDDPNNDRINFRSRR